MKGKIIAWLLIGLIGIPLLLFFGSALVLFLAPGFEIFGVRYVANGVVDFAQEQSVSSAVGVENINIKSYDAPITIEYAAIPGVQVVMKQKFVGFTRTAAKQPSLTVKLEGETINITTVEIQKFIFASKLYDSYYLVIRVPNVGKDIKVNADTATVNVKGVAERAVNLQVSTIGKLTIENNLKIGNLNLSTNSDVVIGENVSINNATIKTKNKQISIKCPVTGDLDLTNKSGKIEFNECNNLTVNTSSGSVQSSVDKGAIVNGKVDIKTKSGSIKIDKVLGSSGNSTITTKSGSVDISYINKLTINTTRGRVSIGQAGDIVVNGGSGEVSIGGVLGKIDVTTKNGKVILGSDDGNTIKNPTVKTTTGKIYAYNTMGTVSLRSDNNKVYIKNTQGAGANKFQLSAGKTLTAVNLEGEVNAYANGEVNLHFQNLSKDVNIEVGSRCKVVNIDAKCKLFDEVKYLLKSSKNKPATVYAGSDIVATGGAINNLSNPMLVAAPKITVTGVYQTTKLYLGSL